jgi:hypothetical protein
LVSLGKLHLLFADSGYRAKLPIPYSTKRLARPAYKDDFYLLLQSKEQGIGGNYYAFGYVYAAYLFGRNTLFFAFFGAYLKDVVVAAKAGAIGIEYDLHGSWA